MPFIVPPAGVAQTIPLSAVTLDGSSQLRLPLDWNVLVGGREYVVTTSGAGLVRDTAPTPNAFAGLCGSSAVPVAQACLPSGTGPTTYSFTTLDTQPPTLVDATPALACADDGSSATDVSPDAELSLTFSEAVARGACTDDPCFELVPIADFAPMRPGATTIAIGGRGQWAGEVSGLGSSTLVLDPPQLLVEGQWYRLAIKQDAVQDIPMSASLSGNGVAASSLCFRVGDDTPPYITHYSPALGATAVSMLPSSAVRLTFNEAVDAGDVSQVL